MTTTPIVVTQHHLNLTGQNVLTFVSWALTIILLAVTIEMGRRERSPFYVLIVLAAMAGAFAEALYDVAFIIAIHAAHVSQVAVYLCTVLSIVFAVTLVRLAAAFVPGSELVAAAGPGAPPERYQADSTPRHQGRTPSRLTGMPARAETSACETPW